MSELLNRKKRLYSFEQQSKDIFRVDPPIPRIMMIELSNACNHACLFCANPFMQRKIGRIDDDLVERVLREGADLGVREVGFFSTGEPFVSKNLEDYVATARDCGYEYLYITTNGALASPTRIKKVIDAGLTSIKFSINAGSRATYEAVHGKDDWEKVIANLKYASEYRKTLERPFKLYVGFVVTKLTEHEVDAFVETYSHYVDEILPVPAHNQYAQMSGAEQILMTDHSERRNDMCTLPFARIHVTNEGYLTLCCVDYHNYLAIADLNTMSLEDAWHSDAFKDARNRHITGRLEGTLCGNCWQGRTDKIAPIDGALGSHIDFSDVDRKSATAVLSRMKKLQDTE